MPPTSSLGAPVAVTSLAPASLVLGRIGDNDLLSLLDKNTVVATQIRGKRARDDQSRCGQLVLSTVTAFDLGDDDPGLSVSVATMEVMAVDGSDSYTHNGALGGIGSDWTADRYYGPILVAIEEAKRQVLADMEALAEAFWLERRQTIEQMTATGKSGLATRFIALTLSVINNRGTATARWVDLHVKRGKKSMVSRRTTNRGSNYHIGNLKRGTPDELHSAIEAAEMMLRDLRMYQRQIARAKRHLKVADATIPDGPSPPPPFLDDIDWSWTKVLTRDPD